MMKNLLINKKYATFAQDTTKTFMRENNKMTNHCIYCKKEIKRGAFCNKECNNNYQRDNYRLRNNLPLIIYCTVCGTVITKHRNKLYCSVRCGSVAKHVKDYERSNLDKIKTKQWRELCSEDQLNELDLLRKEVMNGDD